MNNSLFVLVIIDKGIVQKVVASDSDIGIQEIANKQVRSYLDSSGYHCDKSVEQATEDGYAKIVKTMLYTPDVEEQHIWNYSFDGEETAADAIKRIPLESNILITGN
ncbi:hypothetical protein ACFYU8_17965 [Brevibacillus sp. NPDC003359]|uniref:hypothetical protein n=1 Tax=unclassified Brevibacillus TaxID=2684853 RepID=UPI0036C7E596